MSLEEKLIKFGRAIGVGPDRLRAATQWDYPDANARINATGFVPADVGRTAGQLDDGSFWELVGINIGEGRVGAWSLLGVAVVDGDIPRAAMLAKGDKGDKGDPGEPGAPGVAGAAQSGAVPFYKADGSQVAIPVQNSALPFYKADGSPSPIPVNGL